MKKFLWLACLLLPFSAWAGDWTLDNQHSQINFVSVKKDSVGEVHHFKTLNGQIEGTHAKVAIDLGSVETGIIIRNQRMQSLLFEVAKYAKATLSADIPSGIADLKAGQSQTFDLPVTVSLHGMQKELKAPVTVVALDAGSLTVFSRQPIIVNAADFGLDKGVEALREIAKLPSIARAVPVSFVLTFKR